MILIYLFLSQTISIESSCNVENCVQCSSSSQSICLECLLPYKPSSQGCYLSDEARIQKVTNCEIYNEEESCIKCNEGYHVFNGFCQANCRDDCICFEPYVCIGHQNEKSGISKERNTQSCGSYCRYCYTYGDCYDCYDGYYLYYGECRICDINNCDSCDNSGYCTDCNSGYYLSSGYCYECSSGCKSCSSYYSCTTCKSGYNKRNYKCERQTTSIVGLIVGLVMGITFIIL